MPYWLIGWRRNGFGRLSLGGFLLLLLSIVVVVVASFSYLATWIPVARLILCCFGLFRAEILVVGSVVINGSGDI